MIDWIVKYWLEVGFGALCAVVAGGFKLMYSKIKADIDERNALKDGVLALLHDRLYQGCNYYIGRGDITASEMQNMEKLYNGYHGLGGNSTGTELWNRAKELPIRQEV